MSTDQTRPTETPVGEIPEWRRGAVYHRALTDNEGFITGREVTVYENLYGTAKLCEGPLACPFGYDHEWQYESLGEAVAAASRWRGEGHPSGRWTRYRPGGADEYKTPAEIVEELTTGLKAANVAMKGVGAAATEAVEAMTAGVDFGADGETIVTFQGGVVNP